MITYDVLVIGGGAAGLSAAVTLARSLRSVLVVDADHPRNAPTHAVHNLLGREGIAPRELLALGRQEAQAYGAEIITDEAIEARRDGSDLSTMVSVASDEGAMAAAAINAELAAPPGLRPSAAQGACRSPGSSEPVRSGSSSSGRPSP